MELKEPEKKVERLEKKVEVRVTCVHGNFCSNLPVELKDLEEYNAEFVPVENGKLRDEGTMIKLDIPNNMTIEGLTNRVLTVGCVRKVLTSVNPKKVNPQ